MRRFIALFLLVIIAATPLVYAGQDGRAEKGVWGREAAVLGRGLLNIVSAPAELIYTPARETDIYPKAWPVTFLPRFIMNAVTRLSSAAYDIVCYPWIVPFTDDLSPLTDYYDLPTYAWSKE